MVLLDMMIGAMALLSGVIVFIAVIIIEGIFLSKKLSSEWFNFKIIGIVIFSNLVSTLIGITGILRIVLTWVVDNFFEFDSDPTIVGIIFVFIVAFFLTLIIEVLINVFFLKKVYKKSEIEKYTLYSNIITYILIGIIIIFSPKH